MKVANDMGTLVYDSEHPLCSMKLCNSQGQLYAFLTVLDMGMPHCPLNPPHQKRYWGRFSWEDEVGSIAAILHNGGKWPQLAGRDK